MPVQIMNGFMKLKNLGVDGAILASLSAGKATINIKTDSIRVTYNGKTSTFAVQSIALSTSFTKWVFLLPELNGFFGQVLAGKETSHVSVAAAPTEVIEIKKAPTAPVAASNVCEAYGAAVAAMGAHPVVSPSLMSQLDPTTLYDAKGLYRPVKGTGAGAKYFLVGVFPGGFKMGIRWNGAKMSTRIEGSIPKDMGPVLTDMGFTQGGSYWSSHAHVPDSAVAKRYYGAMCAALGGSLVPLADMNVIHNKGAG